MKKVIGQLLHEEQGKGQQHDTYTQLYKLGDYKLRIEMKFDGYKFQSYANIKVFSTTELKWNFLAEVHYSHMNGPTLTAEKLLEQAELILETERLRIPHRSNRAQAQDGDNV